MTVAGK